MKIQLYRLIDTLCSLAPIFIMPVIFGLKELSLWRYVIGIVVYMILSSCYKWVCKKLVASKASETKEISKAVKYVSYLVSFIFTLISIALFDYLPLGFVANLSISIALNFILTLTMCYYLAKRL